MSGAMVTQAGRLVGLLAATLMATAGGPVLAETAAQPPLRVGMASNYPPLAFKKDGQLAGIEVDFAKRLGPALGREIVLVETPWEDLPKALTEDKTIDMVMSGTSITEKRKEKVDFTEPYMTIGQMVLIRDADFPRLRDAETLDQTGVRVGFTGDTTSEQWVRQNLPKATLRAFPDTDAGVAALRADEIDAFVVDAPAVWRVTGGLMSKETQIRGLYTPLTREDLAWVVRKGDNRLRSQLNAVLEKWKRDGTIDDIVDDWVTVKKTTIEVKPQQ